MPILLDTPLVIPAEHGGAAETCAHVMMVGFAVKPAAKTTTITMQYGNVVDGAWVPGCRAPFLIVLRDSAEETGGAVNPETGEVEVGVVRAAVTDFTDLRDTMEVVADDVGESYYDALGAALYAWLISGGYYEGTIA